jgi:hypothetical protein
LHSVESGQGVPSSTLSVMQPLVGLHTLMVQGLPSSGHEGGPSAARQRPAAQASLPLQVFPSEHGVPSAALLCAHLPVAGWQALKAQGLLSLSVAHTTGTPLRQLPLLHVWPSHRLPSGHAVPFGSGANEQVPLAGRQPSAVQGLWSSQLGAGPG